MTIQLSIIVIEYQCMERIRAFLGMISKVCAGVSHEIIVTSNSCYSTDKQQKLTQEFPTVRWVFNPKNGGFAYGMNCGMRVANGEFFLICNPDIIILNQLSPAVRYFYRNVQVGAIGPRIEDENGNLQDSCRRFMWLGEFFHRQWNRYVHGQNCQLYSDFDYTQIQRVDWVIGAFIMVRREICEEIHGFDERYFLYVEDMDLNFRIACAGYETHYFPVIKCIYKGTRSSAKFISGGYNRDRDYSWIHLINYLRFLGKATCMKTARLCHPKN